MPLLVHVFLGILLGVIRTVSRDDCINICHREICALSGSLSSGIHSLTQDLGVSILLLFRLGLLFDGVSLILHLVVRTLVLLSFCGCIDPGYIPRNHMLSMSLNVSQVSTVIVFFSDSQTTPFGYFRQSAIGSQFGHLRDDILRYLTWVHASCFDLSVIHYHSRTSCTKLTSSRNIVDYE